jgi:AraC-like DNA-binding protein
MQSIRFQDIEPVVRWAQPFIRTGNIHAIMTNARDHRLVYVLAGKGQIQVNDNVYPADRGSLLVWQSRHRYCLKAPLDKQQSVIVVNFDYTAQNMHVTQTLPVSASDSFDPANSLEDVHFEDLSAMNDPVFLIGMQELEPELLALADEFAQSSFCRQQRLNARMLLILTRVAGTASQSRSLRPTDLGKRVVAYIQSCCEEPLTNHAIGRYFNYHPNTINRIIRQQTGQTLHAFVLRCRILKALHLVQTTELSLADISNRVGFQTLSYFSQSFKKFIGHPPGAFRFNNRAML